MSIGENIKRLRIDAGYTQESVRELTGIGAKYISAIECGKRTPGTDVIKKLCALFGCDEATIRFGKKLQGEEHCLSIEHKMLLEEIALLSQTEQHEWLVRIRKDREKREQAALS